ncbi:MAG: M28 family peptidase [bacterium]
MSFKIRHRPERLVPVRQGLATLVCCFYLGSGAVVLSGVASASAPAADPSATGGVPVFDGDRAMEWLVYQCELGPRIPGSDGNRELREAIVALADSLGLGATTLCFEINDPYAEQRLELCNVVLSVGPHGGSRLWLGAHFDTRPFCDRDPDPARRELPLVGANDGASGVAVLLHLAELLAQRPPSRGVELIFFDGEDYGREGDLNGYCLGSRYLASHWRDFGCPLSYGEPVGLILLDMVGKKGLSIPMEYYSLNQARDWTQQIFERAANLGLTAFQPTAGRAIYDDHVPFLQAGIPAVNLIDFDYPQWHTSQDLPDNCAAASLAEVGTLLIDCIYRP